MLGGISGISGREPVFSAFVPPGHPGGLWSSVFSPHSTVLRKNLIDRLI